MSCSENEIRMIPNRISYVSETETVNAKQTQTAHIRLFHGNWNRLCKINSFFMLHFNNSENHPFAKWKRKKDEKKWAVDIKYWYSVGKYSFSKAVNESQSQYVAKSKVNTFFISIQFVHIRCKQFRFSFVALFLFNRLRSRLNFLFSLWNQYRKHEYKIAVFDVKYHGFRRLRYEERERKKNGDF